MVGAPGAGKTHFATEFAAMFGAPRLSTELFRPFIDDEAVMRQAMLAVLPEMLRTKQTVIFDGPTDRRAWRAELTKIAREAGYKTLFVWVQTDQATAQARFLRVHRGEEAAFAERLRQFSAPHSSEPYIVISGRHTYNTQARTVLTRLSIGARPAPRPSIVTPITPARRSTIHVE